MAAYSGSPTERHEKAFDLQWLLQGQRNEALIGCRGVQRDGRCTEVDGRIQICQYYGGASHEGLCAGPIQPRFCHLGQCASSVDILGRVQCFGNAVKLKGCLSTRAKSLVLHTVLTKRVMQEAGDLLVCQRLIRFSQHITMYAPSTVNKAI